jgi:hypothetical protein
MVRIFFLNYLAALNTIISYRRMVNDFEFIQPFGGNRVPIEGRKKKKPERNLILSDLNGHHHREIYFPITPNTSPKYFPTT